MQTQNPKEWLTSIDAALQYLGDDDNEVARYKKLISIFDDPTDHLVNYQTAVVLVRAINEKREPKWDGKETVCANWFYMGGSSGFRFYDYADWRSASGVGSRLCYFEPEHGEYLAEQFPNVFKRFMLISK